MIVTGHYYLEIACDSCPEYGMFWAPTRFEAKAMARAAGWLLALRDRKVFCPAHAEERRQSRYKG